MAYVLPQALVFQEYRRVSDEVTRTLRAHISGPNAILHRYAEPDEQALINVGPYNRLLDSAYSWPGRQAGGIVDQSSVRVFVENALLLYFQDLVAEVSGGKGTVAPVSGTRNRVRSSTVAFKSNGTSYPRSALLNDRDARVGDVVRIRGVDPEDSECTELELYTYIEGFAADAVAGTINAASADENNAASTAAATSSEQTDGPVNCVEISAIGSGYDGLAAGRPTEVYTIEVIRSSISGCNVAKLRVTSADGEDNVDEVTPADFGEPTTIGTRGLTVIFSNDDTGACESSASVADVASDEFTVGQIWTVTVSQDYEAVCAEEGDTYTGPFDDTYIVEVTKGGTWADLPEITVTTAKGLDASGPTVVSGDNTAVLIGTHGLTISFVDCFGANASSASVAGEPLGGDDALAGLCAGDKFYISVVSGQSGPLQTLILRHDLPEGLLEAEDLDLQLFLAKTVELTQNRLSQPPLTNYDLEETQIILNAGATAYDTTWTLNGVQQPLQLWDGIDAASGLVFGNVYVEYREWVPDLVDSIHFITDVADIDNIPGQLDPANPLKWGVYRALQNSGFTAVGYTAVASPSDLDSWQQVLDRLDGRDDAYYLVPLTYDAEVLQLFAGFVNSQSTPEAGSWRGLVINLQMPTDRMMVGQSSAAVQALRPTSVDGEVVLGTLSDNPEATGTQYTRLTVPGGNSGFVTFGVRAGDTVRFLYTLDAFGASSYSEFVVDQVLSENTLVLLSGHHSTITVPQKLEVWRTLNKAEIVADLQGQAQAYASRRVVATFPDRVGTGGVTQDGIFLAAAFAGLASGSSPHRPLTNVEVLGFDDLTARTTDMFSRTELNALAGSGIMIFTEDRDGTPHVRDALNTDMTDLNSRSESVRRNVDAISYLFLSRLRPYIGRSNVTPSLLSKLRYEITQTVKFLRTSGYTEELGGQLISGEIAQDADGNEILRQHPLAADRVEIVLNLVVPAPTNVIELHLVI